MAPKKGDKIAFYLPNCPEYVYSYLACFYLGCVGVPLDFMLKTDELTSCLEHSGAKILIAKTKMKSLWPILRKPSLVWRRLFLCDDETRRGSKS